MTIQRVVVTGLGIISPLGLCVKDTWEALLNSKSGITQVKNRAAEDLRSRICGTVSDSFQADQSLSRKDQRKLDTFVHYASAAAKEAIEDAKLKTASVPGERVGVTVGSGIGGISSIEHNHNIALQKGTRSISPFFISSSIINMAAGYISMQHGFKGPNFSAVSACTTGAHNIGLAARLIRFGEADVMVAGGAEKATTLLGLGGFSATRALSTRNDEPEKASRPWDKSRDGFVLSDGAAALVLESYEHAKKREAYIYGELLGFGMSADAYHMTLPDETGAGARAAMQLALQDAKISPDSVDYINAHATSTRAGDLLELKAIAELFQASSGRDPMAVSSTKSMLGHMIGAAGAVEAAICLLTLRDQVVPATLNLDDPEESFGLNLTPHTCQKKSVEVALSNSFGFGGTNATLVFRRMK